MLFQHFLQLYISQEKLKYIFTINRICSLMMQSEALGVPLYGIYPLFRPLNSLYTSVMGYSSYAEAVTKSGDTLVMCAVDGEMLAI